MMVDLSFTISSINHHLIIYHHLMTWLISLIYLPSQPPSHLNHHLISFTINHHLPSHQPPSTTISLHLPPSTISIYQLCLSDGQDEIVYQDCLTIYELSDFFPNPVLLLISHVRYPIDIYIIKNIVKNEIINITSSTKLCF